MAVECVLASVAIFHISTRSTHARTHVNTLAQRFGERNPLKWTLLICSCYCRQLSLFHARAHARTRTHTRARTYKIAGRCRLIHKKRHLLLEITSTNSFVQGNFLVILTVCMSKNLRSVTDIFIANLSMADVAVGMLSIPFQFQVTGVSLSLGRPRD